MHRTVAAAGRGRNPSVRSARSAVHRAAPFIRRALTPHPSSRKRTRIIPTRIREIRTMKSAMLLTLVALAGCAAQGARTAEVAAEPATVLRGRLIDGTGAAPVEDGVVVIRGERIACAGRGGALRGPRRRAGDRRGGRHHPPRADRPARARVGRGDAVDVPPRRRDHRARPAQHFREPGDPGRRHRARAAPLPRRSADRRAPELARRAWWPPTSPPPSARWISSPRAGRTSSSCTTACRSSRSPRRRRRRGGWGSR